MHCLWNGVLFMIERIILVGHDKICSISSKQLSSILLLYIGVEFYFLLLKFYYRQASNFKMAFGSDWERLMVTELKRFCQCGTHNCAATASPALQIARFPCSRRLWSANASLWEALSWKFGSSALWEIWWTFDWLVCKDEDCPFCCTGPSILARRRAFSGRNALILICLCCYPFNGNHNHGMLSLRLCLFWLLKLNCSKVEMQ